MLDVTGLRSHMIARRYSYNFTDSVCNQARRANDAGITEDELILLPPRTLALKIYGSEHDSRHKKCATLQNQYIDFRQATGAAE